MAYAPRGILCNYEDLDLLKTLTNLLVDVLGTQNFLLLRIDPYVPLSIRDPEGNILNFNDNGSKVIDNLKKVGFQYKGKNLYFETEKPRWEAIVMLQRDSELIFSKLDKRTRNKIRKALNNGLGVDKDENKNINKLFQFVGKKDGKPIEFYREMVNSFSSDCDIYYVKIKTENYVINSRKNYEKEQENNLQLAEKVQDLSLDPKVRNEYLNQKMESDKLLTQYKNSLLRSTDMLKERPEGIIIGGAMVIKYDNVAYLFTYGIDNDYANLNGGALLKWQIIDDYNQQGYKYINLSAIVGEFDNTDPKKNPYYGLNESKLGYNATVTEYIGEFDLVLNNFQYGLYKRMNK